MKNTNFKRLTVYLNNPTKDKKFHTTFTYEGIRDVSDAIDTVLSLHAEPSDTNQDIQKKIKKATYNGKPIAIFGDKNFTNNGWIVK